MTDQGSPLEELENRLFEWILYLLRGGRPEALERILESGFYPPDRKYELLLSILNDDRTSHEGMLRAEHGDLLIGTNPGHALHLDLDKPEDRDRAEILRSFARVALVTLLLSRDAVLRRPGAFRDQAGNSVDLELTIERAQFRLLAGDILSRNREEISTSEHEPIPAAQSPLLDAQPVSLLRHLLQRIDLEEAAANELSVELWQALDTISQQEQLAPYATQLLLRNTAFSLRQALSIKTFRSRELELREPAALTMFALDSAKAMRIILGERQISRELGPYEIESVLSANSRSVTCVAVDRTAIVGRRVVLKILLPHPPYDCIDPNRETTHRILWTHTAEPILPYQRITQEGKFILLVIEYIPAGNLGDFLRNVSGSLRFRLVLQALADISAALAYAHRKGVFHGAIALEKIFVFPESQRFKLAHFPLPLVSRGEPSAMSEGQGTKEAQQDIRAVAEVLGGLLPLDLSPELKSILDRCPNQGFANAAELREAIAGFREPDRAFVIVLTAERHENTPKVHYDLAIGDSHSPEILGLDLEGDMIREICARWDRIGELALARETSYPLVSDIDREIRNLLGKLSDATHFILGPRIPGKIDRYRRSTLWVRYDPLLAEIPWELLEIAGAHACRQFCMARSPKLVSHVHHPGLPADRKIRLLVIKDPDGSLEGARDECERLVSEIPLSPFSDRIEIKVVDQYSDVFEIWGEIRHSHIVHFAGHGLLDGRYTEDSGLSLGRTLLRARQLGDLWNGEAPFLFFANACRSGRASEDAARQRVYCDAARGLGQAFLGAGVACYIGTLWDAPDGETTIEFAAEFYRWFLSGSTVSRSIHAARECCIKKYGEEDLTWARYVLFGDPLNRIEI